MPKMSYFCPRENQQKSPILNQFIVEDYVSKEWICPSTNKVSLSVNQNQLNNRRK